MFERILQKKSGPQNQRYWCRPTLGVAFSWDAGTIVSYIYIVYSCEPLFGSFQTLGLVARSCAGRWAYNQQKDKVVSPLQIKTRRQGIPSVWGELCIEHEKASLLHEKNWSCFVNWCIC